jgi:hypothetical protein
MSILRILTAVGKGLTPGAPLLATLVTLTVNVCPRWSPNYQPPISATPEGWAVHTRAAHVSTRTAARKPHGLASVAHLGPADTS